MDNYEGQNWAILKSIKVIEYNQATFTKNLNPIPFSSISIENGYEFVEIPHIFESSGFSETEKISEAGHYFEKNIQLTIPKLRTEVTTFLIDYIHRKLLLLVTDANDISHLVYPLRMVVNRNIPGQAASLNATRIEFSGSYQYESPIVTGVS